MTNTLIERLLWNSGPLSNEAADELERQAKEIEGLKADAGRYNWVLPILSGDDDFVANARTIKLGLALAQGMTASAAIDAAMKEIK